ncbi:MAG TPA: alpha/beta fold hydrolase [Frankiaceae bacterium]|nr:alpha/beta fold hydrolase [Frankiaceae bacterium]
MKKRLRDIGEKARRGVSAAADPTALRGAARELAQITTHVALYPLGVAQERARAPEDRYVLRDLPPVHRGLLLADVEAAGTPILLLHGLIDNRSIFNKLRRSLRRRGFDRVVTVNLPMMYRDIPAAARKLAAQVEKLCERTGYERIHIVGHSLGGLVARYYVQRLGGDARVHTLVTLGTPHKGTLAAHLLPQRVVRQMRPGSHILAELDEPVARCRTRFVVFYSDLDQLVVPADYGRLDHPDLTVRNVFLHGVGHLSLPFNGRVVHEIATTLAHLDSGGHTVDAGVGPVRGLPGVPHDGRQGRSEADTRQEEQDLSASAPPA